MTAISNAGWLFWALGSALFAAMTAIFAKIGVSGIAPDFATFLRTAFLVPVLGILVVASGQTQALATISGRTALFLALSALATGASWLCYFRALSLGDAARVAPVAKLSVVLVAILGVTLLGETLSPKAWLGIALILAGIILVARG